jgi:DNA-binding response OmpR family regulator
MSLKDKVILIVDDDIEIINLLSKIFEAQGALALSAQDLTDAKMRVSTNQPHLVFLDIKLGTENGLTFLTYLKSTPFGYGLPVVIFSAIDNPKIMKLVLASGAADFINKPIMASQIIQKARQLLVARKVKVHHFVDYLKFSQDVYMQGKLATYNQNFIEMEANVKIAESANIIIKSKFCEKIDFSASRFIVHKKANRMNRGRYIHTLFYVGIADHNIEKILEMQE